MTKYVDPVEARARERYEQETDPVQREAYALAKRAGFDWYHTESAARSMAVHAAAEILALRLPGPQAAPAEALEPWAEDACDEIDAGFFSGDTFLSAEAVARIEWYMGRWQRELVNIKEHLADEQAATLDRDEWLRRYRARLLERRPSLTSEELDELANIEAHEALSAEYPDNPEKAVDDEAGEWVESRGDNS